MKITPASRPPPPAPRSPLPARTVDVARRRLVAFGSIEMASLPKVFLCYARSDNRHDDPRHRWLDRVRTHLKAYRRSFEVFHDSNLEGGEAWEKLILQQAAECHVAILLISGPFLASDFIVQRELPILLRRWQAGEVLLLPLLISECAVDDVDVGFPDPMEGPGFIKSSALQQPGGTLEALADLPYNTQEKKLHDTASRVHRHVQSLAPKAVAGSSTSTAPAPAPASTSNPVPNAKGGGAWRYHFRRCLPTACFPRRRRRHPRPSVDQLLGDAVRGGAGDAGMVLGVAHARAGLPGLRGGPRGHGRLVARSHVAGRPGDDGAG